MNTIDYSFCIALYIGLLIIRYKNFTLISNHFSDALVERISGFKRYMINQIII